MRYKRILSILFIICMITQCYFSITINATEINGKTVIDYRKYTTSVITENGITTITNIFPANLGQWWTSEQGIINGIAFDSKPFNFPDVYYLYRYPLGYNNVIDINRLPKETEVQIDISYESKYEIYNETWAYITIKCYDKNMVYLGEWTIDQNGYPFPEGPEEFTTVIVSDKDLLDNLPNGTRYINPYITFLPYTGSKQIVAISGDLKLQYKFNGYYSQSDAAYRQEEYWTNVEQGLLNGGQIKLPEKEPITNYEDIENELTGNSTETKENIGNIISNALTFVGGLRPALIFVADITSYTLVKVPFLAGLLYLSLGLGIFASIVNIVSVAIKNTGNNGRNNDKERNKGNNGRKQITSGGKK